jgi:hypothetical protein
MSAECRRIQMIPPSRMKIIFGDAFLLATLWEMERVACGLHPRLFIMAMAARFRLMLKA